MMKRARFARWVVGILAVMGSGCHVTLLEPPVQPFYDQLLAQYPDNAPLLLLVSLEAMERGDYRDARSLLVRYLRQAPDDARGWSALGRCELELGRYHAAEQRFRRALALRQDPGDWAGLAAALVMRGRLAEARDLLERGTRELGSHAALWRVRGDLELASGNPSAALEAYRTSLSLLPDQPDLTQRVADIQEFLTNSR